MTALLLTAKTNPLRRSIRLWSIAACLAPAIIAQAQTSITVLPPVYERLSKATASTTDPDTFSSGVVNLTCPASPSAIISSNQTGTGNILVDNTIFLTVSHVDSAPVGPVNLCPGGQTASCFNLNYEDNYQSYLGKDPDTFAATGGVLPIDISSYLTSGSNQVTIDLVDYGVVLASTTIALYTNCSASGTSGGQISGNPIPSTNIPPNLLTQDFTFSGTTNQLVEGVLDLSLADQQNTLTVQNQTIPIFVDQALDPADWHNYVASTSFATAQCLVHFGEKLPDGNSACKLYTVVCQVGQGSTATGVQCPTSTERNIVVQDIFDGPNFSVPDIHVNGTTYHQGFGFLEAKEQWTGGPCTFDPGSDQIFSCPENLLTLFTGPGKTTSSGTPNGHFNSTFIAVGPVPEYLTSVSFNSCAHEKWVNHHDIKASFKTKPPVVPQPNNWFVAAPAYSITYGISAPDALPSPEFPVPGDTSLFTSAGCTGSGPAKTFQPPPVTLTLEDGKYLLHYFATDCAGTEELKFFKDSTGSWNTTFFTAEIDVDTVKPQIISGPTLSPAPTMIHGTLGYAKGAHVTATYECTDELSGVEKCGPQIFSNPVADTGKLTTFVDTYKAGTFEFGVYVRDAAENVGTRETVTYTVVGP
jgi:hypothetical protein